MFVLPFLAFVFFSLDRALFRFRKIRIKNPKSMLKSSVLDCFFLRGYISNLKMFFVSDSACICGSIHFSSDGRNCRVHPVLGVQTYCRKTNTSRGVLKGLLPAMSDIGRMSILLQGFDTRFGLFRPFSNPTFQHRHHKSSFRHPVLRMLFCKLSRSASTSIAGART